MNTTKMHREEERKVTYGVVRMDANLEVASFESFHGELHIGKFQKCNLKFNN